MFLRRSGGLSCVDSSSQLSEDDAIRPTSDFGSLANRDQLLVLDRHPSESRYVHLPTTFYGAGQ